MTSLTILRNQSLQIERVNQTNTGPAGSFLCCGPLAINRYHFGNATWTSDPVKSNNRTLPVQRTVFTANVAPNGNVYIYGGMSCNGDVLNDLWSYDPQTYLFTQLSSPTESHGLKMHMAVMLPTGDLVVFPGVGYSESINQIMRNSPDGKTVYMFGGKGL
ncbi:hypothetical protein DFQ29_005393 [Apophysomyces sp. BC1021]|nr:hypothetical protein DFQ29_005393 [Apophysomyces sp. BC1021]